MVTVLLVTGTSTGVGKTVITAALAVAAQAGGRSVAVCKPAQTGVGGDYPDEADIDVVQRFRVCREWSWRGTPSRWLRTSRPADRAGRCSNSRLWSTLCARSTRPTT